MAGKVDDVARTCEHALAAANHFDADVRQRSFTRPAFDQFRIELFFELENLHGKGRLADRAGLGRAAKMPVVRKRFQVTQLTQRDHIRSVILIGGLSQSD